MKPYQPHLDSSPNLSLADRDNQPVSITNQNDGTTLVISRFGDLVWDLYPYIPQENLKPGNKVIIWSIPLPDGQFLTDPEHSLLLNSAKEFIWSLFTDPIEGSKRPKMVTLIKKFKYMKFLLRWMVSVGIKDFSGLSGRTIDYVPFAKISNDGEDSLAPATVHARLMILEQIYLQRNKIKDALQTHPWPHETSLSLAGVKRGGENRRPKTEVIPDKIFAQLCSIALDYVQNKSLKILDVLSNLHKIEIFSTNASSKQKTKFRTELARKFGYKGMFEFRSELIFLRTSCYIIIDMFSGIRDSEMMSLTDNCISQSRSKDDTTDLLWLHGTIYKTGIRPKKWLVPKVVQEAIHIMIGLTSYLREVIRNEEIEIENCLSQATSLVKPNQKYAQLNKRLHTVKNQKNKLFLSVCTKNENAISVLSGTTINVDLKNFCVNFNILDSERKYYRLHAHQFRRTYAHHVARAELGDLLTLRDHFGHWSLDMTAYYADGAADGYSVDIELLEMINKEKMLRQTEIVSSYLTTNTAVANGGQWMKEWRTSVQTASNKEELIKEYAGAITLNGTGHSWCVGNARGNGCGGLCLFEAQMCVDCNYSIIGQEHRPVWEGIRNQQNEALALNDMGPGGYARAKQILEQAEKVLKRLDQ